MAVNHGEFETDRVHVALSIRFIKIIRLFDKKLE